jgi:SAM-dependent methyltransferase
MTVKHFYKNIEGWFSFEYLYKRVVAEAVDGQHFVEVGCWKGRSAAFMAVEILHSGKQIQFDCVDTWLGSDEPKHRGDPDVQRARLFEVFLRNIAPVRARVRVVRKSSLNAALGYADDSLDFVFIDAAHDYKSVAADIGAWLPKLKVGGVLAGDDYNKREVAEAVIDTLPAATIEQGKGTGIQWIMRKNEC